MFHLLIDYEGGYAMSALGNKEIMAKNIRKYMEKFRLDRNKICSDLGIKYTTFTDWINANTYPRIDKIEMLANYFHISKADLVEDDSLQTSDGVLIPVYGRVAAGEPIDASQDNIVGYEKIDKDMARRGDFYALQIKGDSMTPMICDGDTIIVREQPDAENGEIVVATINGDDATCKRLRKYKGGIELISINPSYEPYTFDKKDIEEVPVRILGKVVEMRRRFA